jgi:hypothetical protein
MPARLRYRALLLAGLAAMTACSTQPAQSSAPSNSATVASTVSSAATTTAVTPSAPTFPQSTAFTPEQVCQLITPAELQSLLLEPEGQAITILDAPQCKWGGGVSRVSLSVDPIPLQRLNLDPALDKITNVEIAGRRALVIEDHSKTTCGVVVELTRESTIATQGGRGSQGIEAHCLLARQTMDLAIAKITK